MIKHPTGTNKQNCLEMFMLARYKLNWEFNLFFLRSEYVTRFLLELL